MEAFRKGAVQFGVRWKTVNEPTVFLISWMVWIAVAPVPIMPTLFPFRVLASSGHREVWNAGPLNSCTPGMFGRVALFKMPIAVITKRDVYILPVLSVRIQELESSRQCAVEMEVLNCISRFKSNFSAKNWQ